MLIFFVRHGLTSWNAQRRFQGTCDIPLNDVGIAQAQAAAARLTSLSVQRIYHSTLMRAAKTAEIISQATGASCIPTPGFNELSLGAFQGLTLAQAVAQFPREAESYFADQAHAAPPDGETMLHAQRRSLDTLAAIEAEASSACLSNVVIVSHGALLKTLICALLDMPLSSFGRFDVSNGSLTVVEYAQGAHRLLTLNDLAHMDNPFGEMASMRLMI